ncbi:MAG TPA: DPP IV N-terminal domain-containing protein [Anaeromyxobacteraceae bacterium]|nr:DPP IV N-terminal domain-containing protein [Anaeromyxobacteraceae bacterium]
MPSLELAALVMALSLSSPADPASGGDSFLRTFAETRGFSRGRPASASVTPDGRAALFLRAPPRGRAQALLETDVATGATRVLLDPAADAARELGPEERARLERQHVTARGVTAFRLSKDGRRVVAEASGEVHLVDRASGKARRLRAADGAVTPRLSPDGRKLAFVRGGELHVLDLASGRGRQVTRGAKEWLTHGLAEFVAQEEMARYEGFWWSPDGRRLAYQETDEREVEKLSIADPFRPEREPVRFAYPRAGTANAKVRLGVVPARGGGTVWIRWDARRFPYLATVRWPEKGPLTLLVQNRAQTEERLLAADPATGRTRVLLEERDEAWLNLDQDFPRWLDDGSGFLWVSERNGGPELELRGPDGSLRASLVPASAGFVALAGVDGRRGLAWFTACGDDPTQERLFRVSLSGGAPQEVPVGEGPAQVSASLSEDGSALLVTRAGERELQRVAVHRTDGARLAELPSVAIEPPLRMTAEIRKVGPGEGLWTTVVRPGRLEPGRRLPVVLSVYGGPGPAAGTPQGAARHAGRRLLDQWLADRGFVVVAADGRGTPRRGRAFERALRGDFSLPLEDQVAALRALAAEVPEMDLSRVGVWGWSYGGYMSALAVLRRPDVFKAAVAGAPVVDWRDYDTHYTERYLGLPQENAEAYARSSLLGDAPRLSRPLLLVHGTADDNVYLFHSLKLADALFRAGRPFEIVPLAGATHIDRDPEATERLWERAAAFLAEHL